MDIGRISIGRSDFNRVAGLEIVILGQFAFVGWSATHRLKLALGATYPALGPLRLETITWSWSYFPR